MKAQEAVEQHQACLHNRLEIRLEILPDQGTANGLWLIGFRVQGLGFT